MKIKTGETINKMKIDDGIMCVCRYKLVPHVNESCLLKGRCREESACYYTNANEPVRDAPKLVSWSQTLRRFSCESLAP